MSATSATTITLPWSPGCHYEPFPVFYWLDLDTDHPTRHEGYEGYWCTAEDHMAVRDCPHVHEVRPTLKVEE